MRCLDFSYSNTLNFKNFLFFNKDIYNYFKLYYNIKCLLIMNFKTVIDKYFIYFNDFKHLFNVWNYWNNEYFINEKFNLNKFDLKLKLKMFKLMQKVNKVLIKNKIWNKTHFYKLYLEYLSKFGQRNFHFNFFLNKTSKIMFNKNYTYNNKLYYFNIKKKYELKNIKYKKIKFIGDVLKNFYFFKNFLFDLDLKKFFYIFRKFYFIYSFIVKILFTFFYNLKFLMLSIKKKFKKFIKFFCFLNINLVYKFYKKWLIVKKAVKHYRENNEYHIQRLKDKYLLCKQKISNIRKQNRYRFLNYFKRRSIKILKNKLRKIRRKRSCLFTLYVRAFRYYIQKDKKYMVKNFDSIQAAYKKNMYRFDKFLLSIKNTIKYRSKKKMKRKLWFKFLEKEKVKILEKKRFRFFQRPRKFMKNIKEVFDKIKIEI